MSRLFDAMHNGRLPVPVGRFLPAPRLPGAVAEHDLPMLRLWQAIEARLGEKPRKVVQITACAAGEEDPAVAARLGRLAGRALGGGVIVLNRTPSEEGGDDPDEPLAFGPLPGRNGEPRALDPGLLRAYWRLLGERYPLVVLDTPPVLASPLAQALAPTVDGVVLLIEAERTRADVARAARDALSVGGATLLGAVLNKRRNPIPGAIYNWL